MIARRNVIRPLLVLGLVLGVSSVGSAPAGASNQVIWQGDDVPADLQELVTERGATTADGTAPWAGIEYPGPVGPDGCAEVPTDGNGRMNWAVPGGETVKTNFTTAQLCNLDGGGQELRVSGPTLSMDEQTVLGSARGRVYRASPTSPMTRLDVEFTDGRCFALGAIAGYPGDGSDPEEYVMQGWNYAADPSVDCFSRVLPVASTTTASVGPTSTSTSSTTPSSSTTTTTSSPAAAPANAVAGSPSYTG